MTEKRANQSEQIINAAFRCISLKGYANVSLRDIANEAGVALSQLHYYYGSKKDLLKEIIKNMADKYFSDIDNYLKKEQNAKNKPSSLIKYFQEKLKDNSDHLKVLYDLSSLALWSDSFKGLLSGLFNDLSKRIEELILNNESLKENFKEYNPKSLSRMLLGSMLGISLQGLLDSDNSEIMETFDAAHILFD